MNFIRRADLHGNAPCVSRAGGGGGGGGGHKAVEQAVVRSTDIRGAAF